VTGRQVLGSNRHFHYSTGIRAQQGSVYYTSSVDITWKSQLFIYVFFFGYSSCSLNRTKGVGKGGGHWGLMSLPKFLTLQLFFFLNALECVFQVVKLKNFAGFWGLCPQTLVLHLIPHKTSFPRVIKTLLY
jgi:hypothetical protein